MTSLHREAFFRDLGYEPHPGQLAIHRSPAPRRVVACGVRWGKTLSAAMEGLASAMEPAERSMGWVAAPTYDLADKVFREIQLIVLKHLRHRVVTLKESERRVVVRNMGGGLSEIRAKSADNPVSLLGEGLDWLIVDEAARLKPLIWQNHLSQRLIDKRGWALMISTPKGKGWFFDLYRRGLSDDPDYEAWNNPSWTNPHLDKELIDAERGRLPERVFQQEYGAQFVEGSGAVFRNVRECATGVFEEPQPGKSYHVGLDLAKIEDFTVAVVIDQDRRVVFVDRFHRLPWDVQTGRVKALSERFNFARVLCDTTGAGEPVYESMWKDGIPVEPCPFTARSKAALVDNLSVMIEKREITLPKAMVWPEGIDELEAFQYSVSDAGNVKTGAPSGYHDDCVVALALAAWQVKAMPTGPCIGWIDIPDLLR